MNRIHIPAFGFAVGFASAVAYLACVFVMALTPTETTVRFFNSLMHGVDVGPILRENIGVGEVAIGVISIFVLGWLFGAIIAAFYNLVAKKSV